MADFNPDGKRRDKKTDIAVNIIGAGLAGLSAAVHLAAAGVKSRLISSQISERAQSVLAEGGINGALNTMGENDCTENHFHDTMKAGCDIADEAAVRDLTENAPGMINWLADLGVPFQRNGDVIQQRNFGGQKKKRTAYAQSSIGKVLMTALIDEARKYENEGLIVRYPRHDFVKLSYGGNRTGCAAPGEDRSCEDPENRMCTGVVITDNVTGELFSFSGPVIMACGGLSGMFPARTTGTTADTGDAAAELFYEGVLFSNLEMIQFHPTTLPIAGKRLLVSEAARGEGGRLFTVRNGERWYFMEEKYPELGNLMPRDVVSREEYFVMHDPSCSGKVYLDCTGLPAETWKKRLPDLRREVIYYTEKDPAKEPISIEPGIHYFMGGIHTDMYHRTNVRGLYAAGECCSLYHGANRLGGNSTLGAVYGGKKAAETVISEIQYAGEAVFSGPEASTGPRTVSEASASPHTASEASASPHTVSEGSSGSRTVSEMSFAPDNERDVRKDRQTAAAADEKLGKILYDSLGVVRTGDEMKAAGDRLIKMMDETSGSRERKRILLGIAILESAVFRRESRGAQYRSDYPERNPDFEGTVTARHEKKSGSGGISIGFVKRGA